MPMISVTKSTTQTRVAQGSDELSLVLAIGRQLAAMITASQFLVDAQLTAGGAGALWECTLQCIPAADAPACPTLAIDPATIGPAVGICAQQQIQAQIAARIAASAGNFLSLVKLVTCGAGAGGVYAWVAFLSTAAVLPAPGGGGGEAGPPWTWTKIIDAETTATTHNGGPDTPYLTPQDMIAAAVLAGAPGVSGLIVSSPVATAAMDVAVPPGFLLELEALYPVAVNNITTGAASELLTTNIEAAGDVTLGAGTIFEARGLWECVGAFTTTGACQIRISGESNQGSLVGDMANAGGEVELTNCGTNASGAGIVCADLSIFGGVTVLNATCSGQLLMVDTDCIGGGATISVAGGTDIRNTNFSGVAHFVNSAGQDFNIDADSHFSFLEQACTLTNPLKARTTSAPPQSLRWFANDAYLAGKFMIPGGQNDVMVASTEYTVLVPVPDGVRRCHTLRLRAVNGPVADADVGVTVRTGNTAGGMADTTMQATVPIGSSAAVDAAHPFAVIPGTQMLSLVVTSYPNPSGTPQFVCATLEFD